LRFVVLPDGKDPDDLLKSDGAEAMQALLDASEPLIALLWRGAIAGRSFDSPERRAALDKALREELNKLTDPGLKQHYGEEVRRLRAELFGFGAQRPEGARGRGGPRPRFGQAQPLGSTRGSFLVQREGMEDHLREAVILATLILTPDLLEEFEPDLERLTLDPQHEALRRALLRCPPGADATSVRASVEKDTGTDLENLLRLPHVSLCPGVRQAGDAEAARMCIAGELAKLAARRGVDQEIAEAAEDLDAAEGEALTWRLGQAARARDRAERTTMEDAQDMGEDHEALRQGLQALIDNQIWVRKKG
jgi:DNA primase